MKITNTSNEYADSRETDLRAISAADDSTVFELLLQEYKPYLRARVSRLAGKSEDLREDLMSVACMAFYESVKKYNLDKGPFFPFMNTVIRSRMNDHLRKLYNLRVDTVPLDASSEDGEYQTLYADKASVEAYWEDQQRVDTALEIECFKDELAEWSITMDTLVARSPKQSRLRKVYNNVVHVLAEEASLLDVIFTKRYFPIKKIALLTKTPEEILERGRIYIIASLIIRVGEYEHLKQYVT